MTQDKDQWKTNIEVLVEKAELLGVTEERLKRKEGKRKSIMAKFKNKMFWERNSGVGIKFFE